MRESIFKTLFTLKLKYSNKPREDYLTEILAFVLANDDLLLVDFIQFFEIGKIDRVDDLVIKTQFTYPKLPTHKVNSIPDVSMFLNNHVVFIECKVNAREGDQQLSRYAEHLDGFGLNSNASLVYLTRDFDPKDKNEIFENCKNDIKFIPIRWYEIFSFFKKRNKNLIISEFLNFMKEMGLSSNNQYTPTDLLTLTNFSRVRKMMDETMGDYVLAKFKELTGKVSQHSTRMTQIRNHDRYVYYADHEGGFNFILGYWLNSFSEKEYPEVSILIEVDPKSKTRNLVVDKLKKVIDLEKETQWESYALDSPTEWAGICLSKSLKHFLRDDNHIEAIKKYFIDSLSEIKKAKNILEE